MLGRQHIARQWHKEQLGLAAASSETQKGFKLPVASTGERGDRDRRAA